MFSAYNHVPHMSNSIFTDGFALFPQVDVRATGIYWCSVCKTPAQFTKEQDLPECRNKCGRGRWELVKAAEEQPK